MGLEDGQSKDQSMYQSKNLFPKLPSNVYLRVTSLHTAKSLAIIQDITPASHFQKYSNSIIDHIIGQAGA
ncbi:unnamed protein product [Clonostachys solani]|uniref:Uncharacterized protein n=1 Tax=Clonostachys solani TaxID=160281 RepID=A0A9N9YZM8_9HYPO|nr:unnamed protein product [Clonostachys solani]